MLIRPRRNRRTAAHRDLVRETWLRAEDLVLPLFIVDADDAREEIPSMPGQARLGERQLMDCVESVMKAGIRGIALFPALDDSYKDHRASHSVDETGLLQRRLRALKQRFPDLLVITDVAMDPYSSDGHDGLVENGQILNDETLPILAAMAVSQAEAGADIVAPSDMMDGRIATIRQALDQAGHDQVGICSYCVKYASAFYGPFRDALDSAPKSGDKKTYQMDPANSREAEREVALDEAEGADWLMVKPGLPYLDIVARVRAASSLPVAVYHVSGEYAMLKAAAAKGWIDGERCLLESLLACRRAGADIIFSYGAIEAAGLLAAGS